MNGISYLQFKIWIQCCVSELCKEGGSPLKLTETNCHPCLHAMPLALANCASRPKKANRNWLSAQSVDSFVSVVEGTESEGRTARNLFSCDWN